MIPVLLPSSKREVAAKKRLIFFSYKGNCFLLPARCHIHSGLLSAKDMLL